MADLPSMRRREKPRLVQYPLRLTTTQIAKLDALKQKRGIIPSELIRDAIDVVLKSIEEGGL